MHHPQGPSLMQDNSYMYMHNGLLHVYYVCIHRVLIIMFRVVTRVQIISLVMWDTVACPAGGPEGDVRYVHGIGMDTYSSKN